MDSSFSIKDRQIEIILLLENIFGKGLVVSDKTFGQDINVEIDCDSSRFIEKAEDISFSLSPECSINNAKISYLVGMSSSQDVNVTIEISYDNDGFPIALIIDGKNILSTNCIPRFAVNL